MRGTLFILLAAVALNVATSLASHGADQAWVTTPGGSSAKEALEAPGEVAYVRNPDGTDNTSTRLNISGCSKKGTVQCTVVPDIADTTDHSDSVEFTRCPLTAADRNDHTCKTVCTRPDGGSTIVCAFDGDETTGTEGVYGLTGGALFLEWLTKTGGVGQTECRCVGS